VNALVTGVAGFIGSTLAESLIRDGHRVVGVDSFTPYYGRSLKEWNLRWLLTQSGFTLHELDLRIAPLDDVVRGADLVFHLAAQPGVRASWSEGFPEYVSNNVLATQRLLEAVRGTTLHRFVYASSSSIYGNADSYPTTESCVPQPHSPYGVTKLAGEHLCTVYSRNLAVPTVMLRYFTVYGPRQRPDMAIHRLCEAALTGEPYPLYGDGRQVRDFTFVEDVVAANRAAAEHDGAIGEVFNVAGGSSIAIAELVELVAEAADRSILIERRAAQAGDVDRTGGRIEKARRVVGWSPETDLRTGLERQLEWHRSRR
jgi:UDP-glucuronate 4-epimerase